MTNDWKYQADSLLIGPFENTPKSRFRSSQSGDELIAKIAKQWGQTVSGLWRMAMNDMLFDCINCPDCGYPVFHHQLITWDVPVNPVTGNQEYKFDCPNCDKGFTWSTPGQQYREISAGRVRGKK
jgi:hypothetical protein